MKCPYCGNLGDKVVDSRESKEGEVIRRRLPLHYVSYGQRVPEDIAVPNKKLLIHRSFRASAEQSSFALDSDESLLVAQGAARSREPGLAAFDFA